MARFLGTWELGLGYGHIAHLAPVARELAARGHEMVVAVRHPETAAATPDAPFAGIMAAPRYPASRDKPPTLTYAEVIADAGMGDADAAVALVERWLAIIDAVKPAAIVAEHAPMSLLAAHVAGLPAAMIGSGWAVPPASRPLPSLAPWREADPAERAAADAAADATVRAVCKALGAVELDGIAGLVERSPGFLTTLPELDPYGPRPGATYYGTMGGFRGAAPAPWPAGDGPRAFAYLPFGHSQAPGLVAALAALSWPVVWHCVDPPSAPLPVNIVHTATPVDVAETLADADLLIARAGHATCCEALIAGRPMLLLPDTHETVLLSRRLNMAKLGIGTTLADATSLRAKLEQLVGDAAVAAALRETRARYLNYRPEQAAAELATRLLRELGVKPAFS